MKNTYSQQNGVSGPIFFSSKIDCELLLYANLTKLIGSLCWTKDVSFYSSKQFLSSFDW